MDEIISRRIKKLHHTLNLLHEGIFQSFKRTGKDVNFKLECSFIASKVHKDHRHIYGVFKNCDDLYFQTWEDEHEIYVDLQEISGWDMEILNAEVENDDCIKLYVNCSNTFTGGNLFIHTHELLLYNEDFTEITLEILNDVLEKDL